jgi:hypothetical protein
MTGWIDRAAIGFDLHNPTDKLLAVILPNDELTQEIFGDSKRGAEIESARNL